MTPEQERELEHDLTEQEITRVIGLLGLLRPELIQKFASRPDILREQAKLAFWEVHTVPEPFRKAFRD